MNAAAMVRRVEAGGFTHEQAVCLAETRTDEVESTVATREFVEQAIERFAAEDLAGLRREFGDDLDELRRDFTDELHVLRRATSTKPGIMTNHGSDRRPRADGSVMHIVGEFDARLVMRMQRQRRWFAGIVVVQVAVIVTATVTLAQVFG